MRFASQSAVAALLLRGCVAQYFPPDPEGLTILESKVADGVFISFKEPNICETTDGVKSYSGYVHLPIGTLNDLGVDQTYPINTFFWFFESRKDPANAPLSIWLNGGPGSSSMIGLLQENGPCSINVDSNSTTLNPWSWNNEVNMLYIDQPVQTGFSYDTLHNGTKAYDGSLTLGNFGADVPEQNWTTMVGTFPSMDADNTVNGTANAARAMWHFAQVWFQNFPDYKPNDNRISVWTESYGGKYGPAFMSFFEEQNEKIRNGTWADKGETYEMHLDTLGIINGCIDSLTQDPMYPEFAYNNTYGIQAISRSLYEDAMSTWSRSGGCKDKIEECRSLAKKYDPENQGNNAMVTETCSMANIYCNNALNFPYYQAGLSVYDIAHPYQDPFPPPYFIGYLSQHWVQGALGVPLNWTMSIMSVYDSFSQIGDMVRGGLLEDIAYLLDNNVKVAMVYGDRDYICNWYGGEQASLAVEYSHSEEFRGAGYTEIKTNDSYVGGLVRQYGNFSFSRVFQAGHEVPAYAPDTSYEIFRRAMFNFDIATGNVTTAGNDGVASEGTSSTFNVKNDPPPKPAPTCYVLAMDSSCTSSQLRAVLSGHGVVENYILMDENTQNIFNSAPTATVTPSEASPTSSSTGSASPSKSAGAASSIEPLSMSFFTVLIAFFFGL